MRCPGVYPPDPTLGITDPQMLPPPKLVRAVATTSIGPVRSAVSPAPGTGSSPAPCMTWATRWPGGPATSGSPTPSTTAPGAAASSPPTCPTWPRPRPATPIGSWPWPSGWSSRTAYPIRPPVGTSGATTASSSPSPPSRTGWRPGGKKAADRIGADYLDWALDGFSGYIAADELYDGPFCVLSIVDNRAFKRLCYEVLDHDPTHRDIRRFFRRFRAALTGRGLDPSRDHHRRFGAVSAADFPGLRRREASGLPLPHPGGTEQGGPPRRRSGPQAPGRAEAEASPRAPRHTGGETEGPAAPAPRSEDRGLVRASSSLREAPPHAG